MGKTADELRKEMQASGANDDEISRLTGHRTFQGIVRATLC